MSQNIQDKIPRITLVRDDSLSGSLRRVLTENSVDYICTDPPWGDGGYNLMKYADGSLLKLYESIKVENYDKVWEPFAEDAYYVLKPSRVMSVHTNAFAFTPIVSASEKAGFKFLGDIVRRQTLFPRPDTIIKDHDFILIFQKKPYGNIIQNREEFTEEEDLEIFNKTDNYGRYKDRTTWNPSRSSDPKYSWRVLKREDGTPYGYKAYSRRGAKLPSDKDYAYASIGKAPTSWWDDVPDWHERMKKGCGSFKSEKVIKRLIKRFSNENELILDPFDGSGTTLTVSSKLNRRAIGIDSSSKMILYAINRMEDEGISFGKLDFSNGIPEEITEEKLDSYFKETKDALEIKTKEWKSLDDYFAMRNPYTFQEDIGKLFELKERKVELLPKTGDFGSDLILIDGVRTVVQVKRYAEGKLVSPKVVLTTLGSRIFYKASECILITSSDFTSKARETAERSGNIELWNRNKLVKELKKYPPTEEIKKLLLLERNNLDNY